MLKLCVTVARLAITSYTIWLAMYKPTNTFYSNYIDFSMCASQYVILECYITCVARRVFELQNV